MTWVKLDDQMPDHPKVARVGPLGLAMQVAGLAYCNRNLTDGFIPRSVARTFFDWQTVEADGKLWTLSRTCGMVGTEIDAEWVIESLLMAGIWEWAEGGYQIHDYPDYQPSRAEVEAERAKTRERVQKHRDKSVSNGVTSSVHEDYDAVSTPPPVPVPVPVPENPEARTATHTFTKYLDRFHNSERSFRGVTAERLLEIAQEEGIEAETAGKLLADVWEWWQTVPPSKRWKVPTRGWRGWCRREIKFTKEEAAKAALNGKAAPAPPPLLTTEERMARETAKWAELEKVTASFDVGKEIP